MARGCRLRGRFLCAPHGAVCTQLGTLLPARFLSMLEEEIYGENSPIWEADFTVPAAEGAQLVSRSGTEG